MVLGDVVETIYVVDDEDEDEEIRVRAYVALQRVLSAKVACQTITKKSEMLFVRGMPCKLGLAVSPRANNACRR